MITLKLYDLLGSFAENKDVAREIRTKEILPALDRGEKIILDFQGIDSATQSFIHALISDLIRKKGIKVLDEILFKNCSDTVKQVINIVIEYMQDEDYK